MKLPEKKEFTSSDMTKVFIFGLLLGAVISKIMLLIILSARY